MLDENVPWHTRAAHAAYSFSVCSLPCCDFRSVSLCAVEASRPAKTSLCQVHSGPHQWKAKALPVMQEIISISEGTGWHVLQGPWCLARSYLQGNNPHVEMHFLTYHLLCFPLAVWDFPSHSDRSEDTQESYPLLYQQYSVQASLTWNCVGEVWQLPVMKFWK